MLAFHNDEAVATKYRARVAAHAAADEIIQGQGWTGDGKGCAVGCTLDKYSHEAYPVELGIPLELAHLEDRIHEGLPLADAKLWPGRFLNAPRVGADLSDVWPQFAIWLLTDAQAGVIRFARTDEQRAAIENVAQLYREKVPRGDQRWREARQRAYAAAYAAADADAYAAAYAADAAAYAAAYAAADAYAAAYAAYAAAADARKKHWKACADKLVELLAAA